MSKINDIKSAYNIEDVIGQHIHLKRQGTQLVGNCPFHDDHHASLKVSPVKQNFKCFVSGCGAGGDVVDFFTLQGHSIKEACNIITNGNTTGFYEAPKPREKEVIWRNAMPPQDNLPNPSALTFKDYGAPSNHWAYTDENGNVTGYVLRFDLPEGKKDVIPYTYKTDGKISKWTWRGFDILRPLYNLHELKARPDAIVLLVEGEKTAEAAKKLFPQYAVTTWIGGSENVKNADWLPLHGRRVYMWNDNDLAGVLCMFGGWSLNDKTNEYKRVTGICEMFTAEFKRIQNSPDFPKKWDVADATWTPEEAAAYIKANRVPIPEVSPFPPNEIPLAPVAVPVAPAEPEETHLTPAPSASPSASVPVKPVLTETEDEMKNPHFKCLGFEKFNDQNHYIFYVYRTNVVIKLSAGGINTSNLLQLAPLNYWEGAFPKSTRSGSTKFEINTVADHLISTCSKMGIFNQDKIRGRGAWIDNGVPVIHCGDTLIVDGKYTSFSKHKTRFIYEAGQELGFSLVKPATKQEAYKLIEILERLNWSRDINARLLAGWVVIAPLCGALKWRSHLWLTGASGSGKSWIMINIIKKLLGKMFVDAQGATTEAGIRQYLGADALPVVVDEAESENARGSDRVQSVLELMRASSTSDGGFIIKGSSGGSATQFNMRSVFAFASIGANITQRSDASRISVLELKADLSTDKKERWSETLNMFHGAITEEFVQAFQSRAVYMLPTILKNAATFSNAAAAELDNQRTGDQLGALLAGAYSLTSDSVISFEDAKKWIRERDWSEERMVENTKDEIKVLNRIINADTAVETEVGPKRRTIGELIVAARGDHRNPHESALITQENAGITLKRLGIRVEGTDVIFSDTSEYISKVLTNTAYSKNYHTILSRVNGAVKMDKTTFGSYIKARATKISSHVIFDETQEETPKTQPEAPPMPPVAKQATFF